MIIIIHTLCGRGKKTWEQLQEEGEGEKAANVQVPDFCTYLPHFWHKLIIRVSLNLS